MTWTPLEVSLLPSSLLLFCSTMKTTAAATITAASTPSRAALDCIAGKLLTRLRLVRHGRRLRQRLGRPTRDRRLIDRVPRAQEQKKDDDHQAEQDAQRDSDRAVAHLGEPAAHRTSFS